MDPEPSPSQNPPSFGSSEKRNILVCVAWPYANGYLHLGHLAGSLLSPDIFARYHRGMGNDVLMVSGSDEHGTPIAVRAEAEGRTPGEIVDFYRKQTLKDLGDLGISFDLFFRTSDPAHKKVVTDIFLDLLRKGHIFKKKSVEAYCPSCEKFLPDRFIEGTCPHCGSTGARGDQCDECGKTLDFSELMEPRCKICGKAPVPRETEHYFFRLSHFEDQLRDYIDSHQHMKKNVVLFTRQWLDRGLRDRPITRDINWGIAIPETEDNELRIDNADQKRIYVWFEAVIGYLSTSIEWARRMGQPERWKRFWHDSKAQGYYFLGKDNIPFHSIIFPAILLGYGEGKEAFNLPYSIPANEYLQLDGSQFSKSKGHFITVKEFLEDYSVDSLRYYLTLMMPENRDASFVLAEFMKSINTELVGNLGNFIHRALSFTHKHFAEIPEPGEFKELDRQAFSDMDAYVTRVFAFIENCEFKRALRELMALSQKANVYFDRKAPWKDIREDRAAAGTTLYTSLQFAKVLSYLFYPFLPHAAQRLWGYLNLDVDESTVDLTTILERLSPGQKLERPLPLFTKLDPIRKPEAKPHKKTKPTARNEAKTMKDKGLSFEDLDLRVGTVDSVWDHPSADKLYILKVDLGTEKRQIVAGIRPFYQKEELHKKKVVMVCNLKPAKLRGETSNGMLLAAEKEKIVSVLTAPEAENGTAVKLVEKYSGREIPGLGRKQNMDIGIFARYVMRIGELTEESGFREVVSEEERYPLFESHNLPGNGKFVTMQSPVRGLLVAGDSYVSTDRNEIKQGAGIK